MQIVQNIRNIPKGRTGTESRNVTTVKPKAFSVGNAPTERIPVSVYKTYAEKRPSSMRDNDAPF